ncbi:hypothetical protein NPIL_480221 [Nephila pilipes]|uniref:Uncharacterized protein n=1 Tax=Nephila pilipes TaxID=299642 RepID=A0A8X6QA92_NEPPI|nr:hypothetical protein NPIL_480221 [Nephila pilipes]
MHYAVKGGNLQALPPIGRSFRFYASSGFRVRKIDNGYRGVVDVPPPYSDSAPKVGDSSECAPAATAAPALANEKACRCWPIDPVICRSKRQK